MDVLFRSSTGPDEFNGIAGGLAARQVLANSLLVIGLENLAGTRKAFVNFGDREMDRALSQLNAPEFIFESREDRPRCGKQGNGVP